MIPKPFLRCLASAIALSSLANAGMIVTNGHIVGGTVTGTLVAIDSPFISNANSTTGTFGGPSWTTGGTIFAHQADQGFAAPSSPSGDGIREFDSGGTPWEPDGTPFSQARGYYIYPDGPSPGTTWTFNLAASGIDLPDGTIIHGVYARFGGRNNDKARYEFTEGASSGNLVVDQNAVSSVGDLALRWFDADGNPRDSNFQRIFSAPVTVTGGDGFQLKVTDSTGNSGHIDAIILDTSLPKVNDVPAISTLLPVDNKTSVVPWTSFEVTFDEPIAFTGTGTVTITDLTDGSSTRVINLPDPQVTSPNGDDLLIKPTSRLEFGTQYSVRISANAVVDLAPVPNAFPGILDDTTYNITTRPVPDTMHNVLIVTAALADAQPSANAAVATNLLFHDPKNVDEAMRAASYQRIGLNLGDGSGLPGAVDLVYPGLTVATAGGSQSLKNRMATSLAAMGYNTAMSNFRFILYLQPAAMNTGNDGWANLFSNTSVYLAAPFNLKLAMHEMGHCLGGNHSNGSDLGCSLGGSDVDYNASKKILFGWLNTPAGNVLNLPANTGTSQTLVPLSRDPDVMPGMRAIRVPNPNGGTATFLVSYKINDGPYNTLQNSSYAQKVHVTEDAGGSATTHRATLGAGQTYTNGKLRVICDTIASDNLSAAVNISVGNPVMVSIADDVSGGPVTVGQPVNFTVTFDEAINAATIGIDDFENGSTAGITVNSVSATANPAVFTVAVSTTASGNLNLRIKAGAVIEDLSAARLTTDTALPDNTTIAVNPISAPTLVSIADDVAGGPVIVGAPVNYTVSFSEAMNASTLGNDDFENGGSAGITVNSVSATGNPAVFIVAVTTTSAGPLTLRIKAGAVIEDLVATPFNSTSAVPDDTTISVKTTSAPVLLFINDNTIGGSISAGNPVTYTVTFDEAINAATIGTGDFENGISDDIVVNSVSATANPAVFTVIVTSIYAGNLNLQIKAGAVIEDLAGFLLDTTSALPDETTISVNPPAPPTLLSITDNVPGGQVAVGAPVSYTITFDKAINASTIGTDDFENGSSATITVNSASATANPVVFTVAVTATSSGNLNLRIKAGAVIEDNLGLPLNTATALPDDTTLTVIPGTRWWDGGTVNLAGNGNAASAGGAGTWDTTIQNWDQGNGLPYAAWNNSYGDTAVFAGTAGTVTLGANITASGLRFDTANYSVTSGTITLGSPATIAANANATISSIIDGANGLTKSGSGTLTLAGNNTFTGGLNINAGTILYDSASNANIWGASGNLITFTGNAALHNNNNAYTLARGIAINGGITGTISGAFGESTNVTGIVSGSGTMAVSGASNGWALTLSNTANTFNGPITITNASGGTSLTAASLGDSTGAGSITLGNTGNTAVFTYSGANSALLLDDRQFIMAGTTGSATINSSSSGNNTLTINTHLSVTGVGAKTLTLGGSNTGSNTFAGNIVNGSGTIALTKADGGAWTLTGANTYSGKTSVSQGTLSFNSIGNVSGTASALGIPSSASNGAIALGSGTTTAATLRYIGTGHTSDRAINLAATTTGGGTLDHSGSGLLKFTGDVTNSGTAKTLILQGSTAGTGELAGIISNGTGPLAITKNGSGTWVLSGANSYLGATAVTAGKLVINGDSSAATGAITVSANATLGGTGTLGGNTSIAANGRLEFDLTASHDALDIAPGKSFGFAGASFLTITSDGGVLPGTYTLVTGGNNITGSAPALSLPANWAATVSISGNSLLLNVTSTGAPTLVSISDDKSGGPVFINTLVTYTVTFSKDMDAGTITAADFDNQGTSALTIGTITETSPGVFSVQVTPTSSGTLRLRIPTGSVLSDTSANNLVVPVSDDTTIPVQTAYQAWSLGANFADDANNDGVDNGLAFLLGASAPNVSAIGLLPKVTESGGNLVIEFDCLAAAQRGAVLLNLQHSSDLGVADTWATALVPGVVGNSTVSNVDFVVTDPGTPGGPLKVVATVQASQASLGKLFSRLRGTE